MRDCQIHLECLIGCCSASHGFHSVVRTKHQETLGFSQSSDHFRLSLQCRLHYSDALNLKSTGPYLEVHVLVYGGL